MYVQLYSWAKTLQLLFSLAFGFIYEVDIDQPRKTASLCNPLIVSDPDQHSFGLLSPDFRETKWGPKMRKREFRRAGCFRFESWKILAAYKSPTKRPKHKHMEFFVQTRNVTFCLKTLVGHQGLWIQNITVGGLP
jgi:hypothetical protein